MPDYLDRAYDALVANNDSIRYPALPLSAEAASKICMEQCKAMCCRGPIILRLAPGEVDRFAALAGGIGVTAQISTNADGGGWLRFTDHPGERCPMLDPENYSCRIYADRPQRCRTFPEKPEPGCAISGWREEGAV